MADQPITGRYRLYKQGTDILETWLVRTSSAICGNGHGKGTLKKGQNHYTLTTSDCIKLAEQIAKVGVAAPERIMKITLEVVRGHEASARWYTGKNPGAGVEPTADDDGNAFFIDVLKKVYDLLQPLPRTLAIAKQTTKMRKTDEQSTRTQQSSEPEALANLFELLQLEEPAEISDAVGTESTKARNKARSLDDEVEQQVKEEQARRRAKEDTKFAIWCLSGGHPPVCD